MNARQPGVLALIAFALIASRLPAQQGGAGARKEIDAATGRISATAAPIPRMDPAPAGPASKIDPALRRWAEAAGGAPVTVILWLRGDASLADARRSEEAALAAGAGSDGARAELLARVRMAHRGVTLEARALLVSLGLPVDYAEEAVPVIATRAGAAALPSLAESPAISRLFAWPGFENATGQPIRTHRWDRVMDFGVRGDGVKVAVIEDNGITDQNPSLRVTEWFNAVNNAGAHATADAGIIGSADWNFPGSARGVELLSGNALDYGPAQIMGATIWAIGRNARVLNMSFGASFPTALFPGQPPAQMQAIDFFVDHLVRVFGVTIVCAAGNEGGPCFGGNPNIPAQLLGVPGEVHSPGKGWNVITVGSMNDNGTSDWDDDVVDVCSSFVDPASLHGDREKPELCAVGTDITTANLAGGSTPAGSGTSYSAAVISGVAACLIQAEPGFSNWPEPVKAVLMTAAAHNVEGAARLSDRDGAGGLNGLQAYRIVEKRQYIYGTLFPASFNTNGAFVHDIFLRAGDRTRVSLCWDSRSNGAGGPDVLDADLDIAILQGQHQTVGGVLAASLSWDNSYEIVDFCPPATGWYTVRVSPFRFDGASEYYGLAWTQDADGRYARLREHLPINAAADVGGPIIGTAFPLDLTDRQNPYHPFLCMASLGTMNGIELGGCRRLPLDLDPIALFSLTPGNPVFLDFAGVLDSFGQSSPDPYLGGLSTPPQIVIPDDPGLIGLPLHVAAITLEAGSPNGIEELSEVKTLVIEGHSTELQLAAGGSAIVDIGFSFPFYGQGWTQCSVNASGNITFGGPAGWGALPVQNLQVFVTDLPRIAAFWCHLDPAGGGKVRYRRAGNRFIVEWVVVPIVGTGGLTITSTAVLSADGTIELKSGPLPLTTGIIGITPGGLAGPLPETDLTHGFQRTLIGAPIYEEFSGGIDLCDLQSVTGGALRNIVRFTRRDALNYVFTLDMPRSGY